MGLVILLAAIALTASGPDDGGAIDALRQDVPELRRSLRHDELISRLEKLAEAELEAELEEDDRAAVAGWVAVVSAERRLLERVAPLASLRARQLQELVEILERHELDAREEIALARYCYLHQMRGAGENAIARARDLDGELKEETDRLIADGRGEDVPRGGYFRYRGRLVPMERRDRERALDEALERLCAVAPPPGEEFLPDGQEANLARFTKRFGAAGGDWLRRGAERARAQLRGGYDEIRGWLPSYAKPPSLRDNLLSRREEMRQPRRDALDLIARYDKPEQPRVDANRRNLERLYGRYDELLGIDRRALCAVRPERAYELLNGIRAAEGALAAVDRYLETYADRGLDEMPVFPSPESSTTTQHILPGRKHSGLEDALWVVAHYAAGQYVETIGRADELLRSRRRLTPWEVLLLEELTADAIDRYNAECATSLDLEERCFVGVVNSYRRTLGLMPFEVEERLNVGARKHSREMVVLGYFGHISPVARNRTPTDRVRREGYGGGVGENCLGGHADGRGAFEAWYHSPGHHRGMVSGGPHLGIGATRGHDMWTMVAGGTDYSWRHLHRDRPPAEKQRLAELAVRYGLAAAGPSDTAEFRRAAAARLPAILPPVARLAFASSNDPLAPNRDGWVELARFLVNADVPTDWRPLQIAAVAAAIDGMELEKKADTRRALYALVRPLIGDEVSYDPKGLAIRRRKAAQAIAVHWEDVGQFRYRQGAVADLPSPPKPAGRVGDGPSLKSPLKVLTERERLSIARRLGGSSETERAVDRGLQFLARVQDQDGGWRARSFATLDRRFRGHEKHLGLGNAEWDIAMTGLALLAFQSAGSTPDQGKYAENVRRGLQFLMERIIDYGKFETTASHYMYSHAIATQALCEAYAYTADPRIGVSAQLCLDYLAYAQHQLSGGWHYDANEQGDMSVTGWVIMALNSGYKAQLDVAGFRGALRFLNSVTWPAYFRIGYTGTKDGGTARLGAVGMLARLFLEGKKGDSRVLVNAWRLQREPPRAGREDFYYWYYATLAMFQLGGDFWKVWNDGLVEALLAGQETSARSPFCGSWPPKGEHGGSGGRVYQTSLGVLMLTTYYRYDRLRTPRVVPFTGDMSKTLGPFLDTLRNEQDELVRAVTAAKLVDRYGTAAASALVKVLRDEGEKTEFRRQVAELLMDCVGPDHEVVLLELLASEKDAQILESIIRALELTCSERSIDVLIPYLDHGEYHVRGYAARTLGRIGDPRAAVAMAKRLEEEKDGWCRSLMEQALARLSHVEAIEVIVRDALGRKGKQRLVVLQGLDLLDRGGIADRLLSRKEAEPELYSRAQDAIREHREAAAVPVLIVLLSSGDRDLRAEAIKLLDTLVRERHGFDADKSDAEQKAAIVRWEHWWRERLAEFGASK